MPRFSILPSEAQWLKLSWTCWLDSMLFGLFGNAVIGGAERAVIVEGLAAGMALFSRELEGGQTGERLPSMTAGRLDARTEQLDQLARAGKAQGHALYSGKFADVAPAAAGTAIVTAALSSLLDRFQHQTDRVSMRETFLMELHDARA
jgi:hypothetical protein